MKESDRLLVKGSLVRVWGALMRLCRQLVPWKPAIRIERFHSIFKFTTQSVN